MIDDANEAPDIANVEITAEMIEAGAKEYALFDFYDPGDWVVSAIYCAMEKSRRSSANLRPHRLPSRRAATTDAKLCDMPSDTGCEDVSYPRRTGASGRMLGSKTQAG
jgi:hypothetical protein